MSNERPSKREIKKSYDSLPEDDIKYGIVTALQWYGSLNLTKLSKMIKRPESTTIRHLKQLVKSGLIRVDSDKTGSSWGTFYELSPYVKQLYEKSQKEFDRRIENITASLEGYENMTEEDLQKYFQEQVVTMEKLDELYRFRNYSVHVENIQHLIVNELFDSVEEIKEKIEIEGLEAVKEKIIIPPVDISIYVNKLELSKIKHIIMINEVIFKFLAEIKRVENKIKKEMDQEGVPEDERVTQFVNLFSGSLEQKFNFKE